MNNDTGVHTPDLLSGVDEFAPHQDDARYTSVLARLRALLPAAQHIDAKVAEMMPDEPPPRRKRYADPVDLVLIKLLKPLHVYVADRIESAIEDTESNLKSVRAAAHQKAQQELDEIEARARILRQQLGHTTGS